MYTLVMMFSFGKSLVIWYISKRVGHEMIKQYIAKLQKILIKINLV